MTSSIGEHEYDADLLNAAPKPDKRRIQEGYDADILNKPEKPTPTPKSSTPRVTKPVAPNPDTDLERAAPSRASSSGAVALLPTKKRPFYKTPKGLAIIGAVLVAIIVAAVVGGVVGGRKKSSTAAPASTQPAGADTTQPSQATASSGGDGNGAGQGGASQGTASTRTTVTGTGAAETTAAAGLPTPR